MSDVKRELIFTNVFLDDLIEIEEYIGRNNPKKGRQFTSKVYDYILDMIQIFPFANLKNSFDYEEENIRKGVFDKHHVILYEITETTIDILRIYHTSRNIDNINPK